MKRTDKSIAASLALLVVLSSPGWQASCLLAQTVAQAVPGSGVPAMTAAGAGVVSRLNAVVPSLQAPSLTQAVPAALLGAPASLRPEKLIPLSALSAPIALGSLALSQPRLAASAADGSPSAARKTRPADLIRKTSTRVSASLNLPGLKPEAPAESSTDAAARVFAALHGEKLIAGGEGAVSVEGAGAFSAAPARNAAPLAKSDSRPASREAAEVPAVRTQEPQRASWAAWTNRLIVAAGIIFSFLLVPQIAKNFINLSAGHAQALSALPWMGFATNVLANSLYLGHFRAKKEHSRAAIQLIGVLAGTVVLGQIFLAGFMPLPAFLATTAIVALDLGFNFLAYKGKLPDRAWKGWAEATGLLGLAILPQVLWSTFAPAAMASTAPLLLAGAAALAVYALKRAGLLPAPVNKAWQALGGLTGTLLFMFGPVAGLVAMAVHPADIAGIALGSVLLGLLGDLLLSPRLMLTKDRMGLTSNLWSILLGGLARLAWMYLCGSVPALVFWPIAALVPAYFAFAAAMNRRHPL